MVLGVAKSDVGRFLEARARKWVGDNRPDGGEGSNSVRYGRKFRAGTSKDRF